MSRQSRQAVLAPPETTAAFFRERRFIDRRSRQVGAGLSVFIHLAMVLGIIAAWTGTVRRDETPAITVSLVTPEAPPPPLMAAPLPAAPVTAAAVKAPAPKAPDKPKSRPRHIVHTSIAAEPAPESAPVLTETQLAGAATAEGSGAGFGSGSGGGACNMAKLVQGALRKDPIVQAAARTTGSGGRALLVWNGDWVQGSGQDGKGLAAVREAIMWEVAFAPAACRREPVHGLVLLSLNDSPGSARLVVGAEGWRWADLLAARGTTLSDR